MSENLQSPRRGRPVRLTMPASVANDLGRLQETLVGLAERMGHPTCASGCHPLYFHTESDFIAGGDVDSNPPPVPWAETAGAGNRIDVFLPEGATYDIEQLKAASEIVAARINCRYCHSGIDPTFRDESEGFTIDPGELSSSAA